MPLTDDERQRLQSLANRATSTDPAGGNIQVQPNAPTTNAWDPQGFAASGGKSAEERQAAPQQPAAQPAAPTAAPAAAGGMGGKLTDSWNTFIDHPENRAGLMQFAVNMLSGKGLGESIGAGAEAAGRSVTSQQEAERLDEAQTLREQEAARKERETDYYGIMARKKSGADTYYEKMDYRAQQQLDRENRTAWDAWMKDPLARAGILDDIRKKYPNIKSKDDLDKKGNEAARDEAQQALLGGRLGGGGGARAGAPAQQGGNTPVYDAKTGALKGYWDGKKFVPGAPE